MQYLKEAMACQASDLHLTVEAPPVVRVDGSLIRLGEDRLKPPDLLDAFNEVASPEIQKRFAERGDVDFSYSVPSFGRFRVSAYRQRGSVALTVRIIPAKVPALADLGLPFGVTVLARATDGLVLVAGLSGNGKSTTLAAMIDLINAERAANVITIEDPIEYLHRHQQALVNQREVNGDVTSYAEGLRSALRSDPDVIMVGDLRDAETLELALRAAETGQLVLGSLNAADSVSAVERLLDTLPPHKQQQARVQLSGCLRGIVSQRLYPLVGRPGRFALCEVIMGTSVVRKAIRDNKIELMPTLIQTGVRFGMRSFETSLQDLLTAGAITPVDVPAEFAR